MAWIESEPVLTCDCCGYPYQGSSCPNPGCDLNLSAEQKERNAERKRLDDEWTANFRRFYHRKH